MASSSNMESFSLKLIEDHKYDWTSSITTGFGTLSDNILDNSVPTLFYSLNYSQVLLPVQEDKKSLLSTISELFQKASLQNTKCITFWVKWTTDKIVFDVEVNEELRAAMEELLPSSYRFRVKGSVSCSIPQRVSHPHQHQWSHTGSSARPLYHVGPPVTNVKHFDSFLQLDQVNKAKLFADDRQSLLSKALLRQADHDGVHLIWNWNVGVEWNEVSPIKINADWILSRSYECDTTKDVTIVLDDGSEVKCHSFILGAHSQPLAAAISWDNGIKETRTGRVEVKDLSQACANYLLPYFYGVELPVSDLCCEMAFQLFQMAHMYDISEGKLEKKIVELFLCRGAAWYTPDVIMELYFMTKNLEQFQKLTKQCVENFKQMTDAIKQCDRYKELVKDEQLEFLWTLVNSMV